MSRPSLRERWLAMDWSSPGRGGTMVCPKTSWDILDADVVNKRRRCRVAAWEAWTLIWAIRRTDWSRRGHSATPIMIEDEEPNCHSGKLVRTA
jgi:hypothetical protein